MARRINRKERSVAPPSGVAPLNGRPRQNVGRSTISVAQARAKLVDDLRPLSLQQQAPSRVSSRTTLASDQQSVAKKPQKAKSKLEISRADPLRLDDTGRTCKARPAKSAGNGGSRPFVPWCR